MERKTFEDFKMKNGNSVLVQAMIRAVAIYPMSESFQFGNWCQL